MSKYEPLYQHLQASDRATLDFSFSDIEEILGFSLPASARRYPAWWSNSDASHVQAQAWLRANYETTIVDVPGERLRFSSTKGATGFDEVTQAQLTPPSHDASKQKRHPLFGSLKGTSIIMPDVDLTQPADAEWAKVYDDAYDQDAKLEHHGSPQ